MSGIEILKPHCDITQWNNDDPVPRDELISNIKGKDALFCLLTDKIDKAVIEAAGNKLFQALPSHCTINKALQLHD